MCFGGFAATGLKPMIAIHRLYDSTATLVSLFMATDRPPKSILRKPIKMFAGRHWTDRVDGEYAYSEDGERHYLYVSYV